MAIVEERGRHGDLLHQTVRVGLPVLQAALAAVDQTLPRHVERELANYLGCGDLSRGFAWLECEDCSRHRLVPWSCKTRGFCPSCVGRVMCERSTRWVDELFPRVAVRQWVLTVPWSRRLLLGRRPVLLKGVLDVALRALFGFYAARTGGGRTGAVTVVQRFGSALNLNVHFHVLVPDGAWRRKDGKLTFTRLRALSDVDVAELVAEISRRCERWLARQGYGDDEAGADDDDAQAVIQAAAVAGKSALSRARRTERVGGRERHLPAKCAASAGYNLHGGVVVGANDRKGLEQLCRYVNRPALGVDRLTETGDGRVRLTLKTPWSDGTTSLVLTPMELVERLVAIIPPARANTVFYHGVLGARSALRPDILPKRRATAPAKRSEKLRRGPRWATGWISWASLLWRVFGEDGWLCVCGSRMKLRCVVERSSAAERILEGLRAGRGPP